MKNLWYSTRMNSSIASDRHDVRKYSAYTLTLLKRNFVDYKQGIGCVFESPSRDCIMRKLYQYVCGAAGCGCVVRSFKTNAAGYVAVIKFVPAWDARRLTLEQWSTISPLSPMNRCAL